MSSARWAEPGASIAQLLDRLGDEPNRRARMIAHAVAISPDGREVDAVGVLEGEIAREPRGTGGFGYDPVFVPEGEQDRSPSSGRTGRPSHSHRGKAAQALRAALG